MQRHRFLVTTSPGQYAALLLLAVVCLGSVAFWPALDYPVYPYLRWGALLAMTGYFASRIRTLSRWQLDFWLAGNGEGQFVGSSRFQVGGPVLITPWMVSFPCRGPGGFRRLYLFRDMFDDTNFRHLCRLLLNRHSPYSG
ncbi:protein YgfX [Shewanella sp. YIC-542]|uniref:protein YgfX n=1 Tax=Shewanella mytili TaxID=3377111 RepID=UPI00398EB603